MLIGIISDTHDNVKNLKKAIDFLNRKKVSIVYHCGDWVSPFIFDIIFNEFKPHAEIRGVFGNNEGDRFTILKRIKNHNFPVTLDQYCLKDEIDGKKIAVFHGHNPHLTKSLLACNEYDVVLTGHTHQPIIENLGKTLHINPGTITDAANFKIIENPTLAVYDIKTNQAQIIEFLKEAK